MSDDPQLEEVRGWYIDGRRVHNPFASDSTLVARFDIWLADHDAEVCRDQREKDALKVEDARRQLVDALIRETLTPVEEADGEHAVAMLGRIAAAIRAEGETTGDNR